MFLSLAAREKRYVVSIVVYEIGKDARFVLVSSGSEQETVAMYILNFSNLWKNKKTSFWKNKKAVEPLNVIFENSSPKGRI